MRYVSTRGRAPVLGFDDVLLAGMAVDGGLYVPEIWPRIDLALVSSWAGLSYAALAAEVMAPFVSGYQHIQYFTCCHEKFTYNPRAVPRIFRAAELFWLVEHPRDPAGTLRHG